MTDPPLCACHGEPMRWSKDSPNRKWRHKAGGNWRCAVKQREYDVAYRATPVGSLNREFFELTRIRVRY